MLGYAEEMARAFMEDPTSVDPALVGVVLNLDRAEIHGRAGGRIRGIVYDWRYGLPLVEPPVSYYQGILRTGRARDACPKHDARGSQHPESKRAAHGSLQTRSPYTIAP